MTTIGTHFICELSGCNAHCLNDLEAVKHALNAAALTAGATVLDGYFHRFSPQGVSGLLCLAESHVSIHTWPERGYAAVDIYTCGDTVNPADAVATLAAAFQAHEKSVTKLVRGIQNKERRFTHDIHPLELRAQHLEPRDGDDEVSWYFEDADPHERHLYQVRRWLVSQKTTFQQVGIIQNKSYGRTLFLDGAVQSSERDEYMYHESLIHPAMIMHANPRRVMVLGGGEGASVREVLRHRSVEHVTMADIDGELVSLCRKHLPEWSNGALEDPRVRLVIADGKRWLEDTSDKYDVIFMDLTDQIDLGPSLQLYSQSFFKTVQKRLNPGGIFLVQAGELSVCECFSHGTIRKTLASVFPQVDTYIQHIPSFFAQWSFVVASTNPQSARSAAEIDAAIAARVKGDLRFYDAVSHQRMFMLPKDLRRSLENAGIVHIDGAMFEQAFAESVNFYQDRMAAAGN